MSKIHLNYFPISIACDEYEVNVETYFDERLAELREQYNSTHSFFRNGENICISNYESDSPPSIGSYVKRSTFGDHSLTASLIKHIFFRSFKDRFKGYIPVDFYPFRFFSSQAKDNLIFDALPDSLRYKIAYKKLIEVQLRLTEIGGQKRFGFLINVRRNWIFDKSCSELHAEGYDLSGIDVLHTEFLPGLKSVLAPNEEFIGTVKEVIDGTAIVETNDGVKEFPLSELTIKKTKFNIANYLAFAVSQTKSDEILRLIESKRADIYDPKNLYNEIGKIAKYLFSDKDSPILFSNKDGFCFTVDSNPISCSNTMDLRSPTFIFDPAVTQTVNNYPDSGLSKFGPYDSTIFDIKSPKILAICNRTKRGSFTKFLSSLKDGLPQSKYFTKGLHRKYDLQDVAFDIREIQNYELQEYLDVIKDYDDTKPNLAIIEIPASFKKLPDSSNPYYRVKAKLLALEIPVQFVTTEVVTNHNEYILNSIGLQCYAKMGGTPWVLPAQRSVDREIVIGIGHSWLRKNQYAGAAQNRVVGITTFLSSDGQYLLGDKVKDVSYESYFEELLKSLKQSIERLSTEQGWNDGDTVRLIFHIFKPIKNTEFDVVRQLVRDVSKYNIKFAFVTISKMHPTMMFDTDELGVSSFAQGRSVRKGAFIPKRGSNVFLDAETAIVQMFGPSELKTSTHNMSNPIQIKIRTPQGNHQDSDLDEMIFHDLVYITQQIFSFTYLSWRSFLPAEEPATMKYSNLISKLLGKMRSVPGWDPDRLNYELKRKKWFL